MCKTIKIITESLAFLPSPSRSFSRFARIGIRTIAPGRLSGNIRRRWTRSCSPIPNFRVRRLLRALRDSLSHASPQRRPAELALSVRLPAAPSPAVFQPAEHRVLSNGRREDAKKKRLNARRQCKPASADRAAAAGSRSAADRRRSEPASGPLPLTVELRLEGVVLDESSLASSPMLPYVRMVVSLIEGVELTCREVLRLLRQAMRQRSIGARRRIDYILGFLHQHPP